MPTQITEQPTAEPVTLAEVKARLRLTSTADDALITGLITVAREYAESITFRSLAKKTYAVFFDRFPAPLDPIRVPNPPLITVSAIKYLDASLSQQIWDPSEYFVADMQSPGLIVPKPGFTYPSAARVPGAVEVDCIAGYDASSPDTDPQIPAKFQEGIRQLAVHFYSHPEAVAVEKFNVLPITIKALLTKVYVF